MADEARAMLDALMGADRNAVLPSGAAAGDHHSGGGGGGSHHHASNRRKRSCYDPDACPLYCAWNGTDIHELFTNTKSDIGPNPRICDDAARDEYESLPDHEKDRLGFEFMLYDRLRDLVRGCDRIVNRNKEKLRGEVARQQRARGGKGDGDDPAANISEEKVLKVAEDMARVELLEEEIASLVKELEGLDREETDLIRAAASTPARDDSNKDTKVSEAKKDETEAKSNADDEKKDDDNGSKDDDEAKTSDKEKDNPAETSTKANDAAAAAASATDANGKNKVDEVDPESSLDDESKSKLQDIRTKKRTVLSKLATNLEQIAPLRDAIESEKRRLHFFRSDTTIDKVVCDVSGNFMSYRDADERIAAHYAGKQYVGWKMVRDKYEELKKKYGNASGPARGMGKGGGPPPPYDRRGGPPPGRGGHGYGPPQGYRDDYRRGGDGRRDDRSRSRDRDRGRRGGRRSPDRWERDRAPRGDWERGHGGGGGGGRRDRW